MQALPQPAACCQSCEDPVVVNVPGPAGAAGAAGAAGTDGENAHSFTAANFAQPAANANVAVTCDDTDWMTVLQVVFIEGGGYYQVISKDAPSGGTIATVKNLGYTGNAATAAVIASGSHVSPSGLKGDTGTAGTGSGDLLAANNLSELAATVVTARANLGLVKGIANTNTPQVNDVAGLVADECLFGTATGIKSETATAARALLGVLSMGIQAKTSVDITGGTIVGITDLAIADGGTGSSTAANARTALGIDNQVWRYGVLGRSVGVDLNTSGDNTINIPPSRYIVDKVIVDNATINITTATGGVYTAPAAGGTAIATDQALSALTAATKFKDMTLQAVAGTDTFTTTAVYFRVGTPQGAAATADVHIFGYRLD